MKIFILSLFVKIYFIKCAYNINDDVLFGVSWKDEEELIKDEPKGITMISKDKESFRCILPRNVKDKFDNSFDRSYNGPSEKELLKPLFSNKICSIKIESYWSYEICHGRYVRQFHENSVQGKSSAPQEYSLGVYHDSSLYFESNQHKSQDNNNHELPTITINSVNFPYFMVNMTDGTKCDLIGQSRSINILYICQTEGRGEIYEIHEVVTCHYQAIVFTKLLCAHPGYKVTDNNVNEILCYPMDGVESLPMSLSLIHDEMDSEVNSISTLDGLFYDNVNVGSSQIKVEAYKENGVIIYRIKAVGKQSEDKQRENNLALSNDKLEKSHGDSANRPESLQVETSTLIHRFISGKFCVDGGEGWWQHRVCYNRKISQYHMDMNIEAEEVILGLWREDKHKEWLLRNFDKKPTMPAEERMEIYQYFSEGHFCPEIKAKRDAILRIRCVKDSSNSIMISFLEPRTCSYIITIESSLFCTMIREADEFGFVGPKEV